MLALFQVFVSDDYLLTCKKGLLVHLMEQQ